MPGPTMLCGDYSDLINAIYKCADSSESWSAPLEKLRTIMHANVGCIRIIRKGNLPRLHLFAAGPFADDHALTEWCELAPCELPSSQAQNQAVTITDWTDTIFSKETRELFRRYDIASTICMSIEENDDVQVTLNCSRGFGEEGFRSHDIERFAQLGRHFEQAMALRRQLTRSNVVSQFQTQALDSLGIAAILVSSSNSVSLLNDTAKFAVERGIGLQMTSHGLASAIPEDNSMFQKAMKNALSSAYRGRARAMSLYRDEGYERVHLVIRSQPHQSLLTEEEETSALIFMRVNEVVDEIDVELLQQQFSFTSTEASVAIGLAKGMCLKDVEEKLNIRHNTARAHLRSLFSKAHVGRQSQLVSLLTSSLVPLGRDSSRLLQ